jgi:hypothetical protein
VSNRLKRRPPAAVRTYARAYRCSDCPADVGRPRQDQHGVWRVPIHHEHDCPVLAGTVTRTTAGLTAAAAAAAAAQAGGPVVYLDLDQLAADG